jgi:hypoxanthine-DNA glycosylase
LPLAGWAYGERIAELHRRGLGLWDVVASCRRQGSLDQAIEEPEYNDLAGLTRRAPALRAIACNGAVAAGAVRLAAPPGLPVQRLPSTSPAHASWSAERKLQAWRAMFLAAGV